MLTAYSDPLAVTPYPTPIPTQLLQPQSCLLYCLCVHAELTCQRGQLFDGQLVLEVSCRWGALSVYIASKYPASQVTAVCDSQAQKLFVGQRRRQRGLTNLKVGHLLLEATIAGSVKDTHSRGTMNAISVLMWWLYGKKGLTNLQEEKVNLGIIS